MKPYHSWVIWCVQKTLEHVVVVPFAHLWLHCLPNQDKIAVLILHNIFVLVSIAILSFFGICESKSKLLDTADISL